MGSLSFLMCLVHTTIRGRSRSPDHAIRSQSRSHARSPADHTHLRSQMPITSFDHALDHTDHAINKSDTFCRFAKNLSRSARSRSVCRCFYISLFWPYLFRLHFTNVPAHRKYLWASMPSNKMRLYHAFFFPRTKKSEQVNKKRLYHAFLVPK